MKYYTVYCEDAEEIIDFVNVEQCEEILRLKDLCQIPVFVSKVRLRLRKHYKVIVGEDKSK